MKFNQFSSKQPTWCKLCIVNSLRSTVSIRFTKEDKKNNRPHDDIYDKTIGICWGLWGCVLAIIDSQKAGRPQPKCEPGRQLEILCPVKSQGWWAWHTMAWRACNVRLHRSEFAHVGPGHIKQLIEDRKECSPKLTSWHTMTLSPPPVAFVGQSENYIMFVSLCGTLSAPSFFPCWDHHRLWPKTSIAPCISNRHRPSPCKSRCHQSGKIQPDYN